MLCPKASFIYSIPQSHSTAVVSLATDRRVVLDFPLLTSLYVHHTSMPDNPPHAFECYLFHFGLVVCIVSCTPEVFQILNVELNLTNLCSSTKAR